MADNPITDPQFKALHVWCKMVADVLNEHGLDMKVVLKPEIAIPWEKYTVKEYLWKPILKVYKDKGSTLDMNTVEPDEIVHIIARHLGEKFGVTLPPWPDNRGPRG
jgi:hypothetical protein